MDHGEDLVKFMKEGKIGILGRKPERELLFKHMEDMLTKFNEKETDIFLKKSVFEINSLEEINENYIYQKNIIYVVVVSGKLLKEDFYAIRHCHNNKLEFLIVKISIGDYSKDPYLNQDSIKWLNNLKLGPKIIDLTSDETIKMIEKLKKLAMSKDVSFFKFLFESLIDFAIKLLSLISQKAPASLGEKLDKIIEILETNEKIECQKTKKEAIQAEMIKLSETMRLETDKNETEKKQKLKEMDEEYQKIKDELERITREKIEHVPIMMKEDSTIDFKQSSQQESVIDNLSQYIETLNKQHRAELERIRDLGGQTTTFNEPKTEYFPNINAGNFFKQDVVIENHENPNICVIGLSKSGRSTLVGALAGGIWPHHLTSNPTTLSNYNIYKLFYPENNAMKETLDENLAIYEKFFEAIKIQNLSVLLLTVYGVLRDRDYYMIMLAQKQKVPIAIVVTKLDEWLDVSKQSQKKYVDKQRESIWNALEKEGIKNMKDNIFIISALACITVIEDGLNSEMLKYRQDENLLQQFLIKHGIEWQNPFDVVQNIYPIVSSDKVDIMVAGRNKAGKKTLIESLKIKLSPEPMFSSDSYDDMMLPSDVIRNLSETSANLYIIVVPNTLGSIDAKIIQHFVMTEKRVILVQNKCDEIIDNILNTPKYTDKQSFIDQRKQNSKQELLKLNVDISKVQMFCAIALVIKSFIDDSYATEEQELLEYITNNL